MLTIHVYASAGNYTSIVTATNEAGRVSTSTHVTIINQLSIVIEMRMTQARLKASIFEVIRSGEVKSRGGIDFKRKD